LYLIVGEMIAREVVKVDATAFIGPALATAGLGFLIQLLKPKIPTGVDPAILDGARKAGGSIVSRADQNFIVIVLIVIFTGFFVWLYACNISAVEPTSEIMPHLPKHVAIGFINYFAAIVCAAIKAKV
jgi:hypothetical protein